jgi:serine/threonine protein kinase/tetratricopeptide (TPR) repeat protein
MDFLTRLQTALGDRYRVERELGGGGMSRVFAAQEPGLGRRVAVKVLPLEFGVAVSAERFRREIQLAASLQHPHIVPVLTAGEADGLLYYTMPLIEGETLRARLSREGRLPVPEAIRILCDVLEALAYAHRHGVVHRDIKPENVLLVDNHALVTDFGVAKALTQATGGSSLTSAGVTLGTPAYMAPEQVAADPRVDHRSDIYSTGVMAYEMLGGRPPFAGQSPQRVLAAHITDLPEPVTRVRPDLPAATGSSVMRCLEKDPADRWQSADDLRRELTSGITADSVPPARPTRARQWSVAGAAALAVVLGAVWAASRSRAGNSAVGSPTLVAVLPFSVRGSADVAYLGEGLVNLLSTSLDGAGNLRAVDPHAVLSIAQRGGSGALDPAGGAGLAERLGAGLYVLGDVVEAGGRVRIGASLYDRVQGSSPRARATIEGGRGEVFSLVDGLATQLLAQTSTGPTGRVTRVASVTTASLAAYKAYLDGEAALRAGRADSAVNALQQAIVLDTAFALAYYRLSVAAEWATRASLAEQSAEQAVRHSARLADHDRLLLRALLATRRGAGLEAEGLYRDILATYPDDIEAWIELGEVLFHYGPTLGQPLAQSRPAFERVLYFEPGYVSALVHLARIAALEDRPRAVDSLVGLVLTLSPSSDRALEMRALRAYASRDVAAQQRVQGDLARAPDAVLPLSIWDLAVYAHDLDGAEDVARLLADPGRSRDAQAAGHATLAYLALARGRLGAARLEMQRTAAVDSVRGLEFGTLLELAPFVSPRRGTLETARRALERLDAAAVPASTLPTVYFNAHDGMHGVLRAYLLGVVNARLGDMATAEQYAATLLGEKGPPTDVGLPRDLGLEVKAEVAIAQGSPGAALASLRQRVDQSWFECHFASPFFSGTRGRYLRAGLETDVPQAAVLFSTFEGYAGYALAYAGPARLHRAALYERQGDRAAAARDYAWFLDRWKDCDREFTPLLDTARAGLARVGGPRAER